VAELTTTYGPFNPGANGDVFAAVALAPVKPKAGVTSGLQSHSPFPHAFSLVPPVLPVFPVAVSLVPAVKS